jgi:hypothetical protein
MSEEYNPTPLPTGPTGYPTKPGQLTAIAVLTLISGITNVLVGLAWSFTVVVGTIGLGIICLPITILPLILGVFEIIYASKLMAEPVRTPLNQTIAILEIVAVLSGNIVSLVAGILALVFANDDAVRAYYARLGPIPTSPYPGA